MEPLLSVDLVYREVAEAYLAALETRVAQSLPISRIASVASFFVSFFSWYLYDLVCPFLPWSICESGVLVSAWIYFLAPVIRISFSGI